MSRLWVKIAVFVGLVGAAGVIWGILDAAFFTRSLLILPPHAPESRAAWAMPASVIIVLFAVRLAAHVTTGNTWKAFRALLAVFPIMFVLVITADICCALADLDHAVALYAPMGLFLLFCAIGIAYLVKMRPRGRLERAKCNWQSFGTALATTGGTVLILWLASAKGDDDSPFYDYFCFGGFQLASAWQCGQIALVDFRLWLIRSMLLGGAVAALCGMLQVQQPDQPKAERKILAYATVGFLLGAVISGLMFGAHAVLLLQMYRVAWNDDAVFATSLWVWGIVGGIAGLMLACAVHVMSAEPENRLRRLPTALALTVPPVIIFWAWASAFVRTHDAGRDLLAKAAKLEIHAMWINFNANTKKPACRRIIIHVREPRRMEQSRDRYGGEHTIRLCEEILHKYPDSAYRSAALYLRYWAESCNWRPQEALRTHAELDALYPGHGFGARITGHPLLQNLMLLGDYEEVVRLSRKYARARLDYSLCGAGAYAAEVLGLWDDVIRVYEGKIAWLQATTEYKSRSYYKDLEEYRAKIRDAEQKKARGVGPRPKTNVEGRVLLAGKPFAGRRICLIPARPNSKVTSASGAGLRGGLLAVTDGGGFYRIPRVPSGEYEVLLVIGVDEIPEGFTVRAPGVPYQITGCFVRLPDIWLTASTSKG